jgi:hypothetical protein
VRLRAAPFGVVAEIIAAPAPGAAARPAWRRAALLLLRWLLLLVLPPACLFCRPAIGSPAGNPPRYRVPLRAVTVGHAAAALTAVAPAWVTVTVLTHRPRPTAERQQPAPVLPAPVTTGSAVAG